MTDASALRLRLGAIGAALRAVDGTDRHEALSRVQSNAVVAMLQRVWANISPEDKAAMLDAADRAIGQIDSLINGELEPVMKTLHTQQKGQP